MSQPTTFYPDEDRIRALLRGLRGRPQQRWHLPAACFWAMLGAQQATINERQDLLESLRRRNISVTQDVRRGAMYLVWTGDLQRKKQGGKSPRNWHKQGTKQGG